MRQMIEDNQICISVSKMDRDIADHTEERGSTDEMVRDD